MRMIRLRRKKESFRFRDEFRIVPRWLKSFVSFCTDRGGYCHYRYECLAGSSAARFHDNAAAASLPSSESSPRYPHPFDLHFYPGLCESRRQAPRHEPDSLDTAGGGLVARLPLIGLIIYLLIVNRFPTLVRAAANWSARASISAQLQMRPASSCPNCKHEIAEPNKFCPYCAQDLAGGLPIESPLHSARRSDAA